MNFPATFRENFSPFLHCNTCCDVRFFNPVTVSSSIVARWKCTPNNKSQAKRLVFRRTRKFVPCRVAETETEPDSNNDKENEKNVDEEVSPSSPIESANVELDQKNENIEAGEVSPSSPIESVNVQLDQNNEPSVEIESLQLNESAGNTDNELKSQGAIKENENIEDGQVSPSSPIGSVNGQLDQNNEQSVETENTDSEVKSQSVIQEGENIEIASGSPLPGMKQLGEVARIPKETVDILKGQVFGFDTFFVTSQEPYEGGMLFKGNLRGKASQSYEKITKRLEDKFGDQYKLFLLVNPEDDKPVAVVVPRKTLYPETTAVPEWFAAGAFGLVTIFTLLLRNVPELQSNLLSTFDNVSSLKDGLTGALVTALILGVHELGQVFVARSSGIKLGVPYFIPSWQIGSFGAITRIVNIVRNREDLLKLGAAGPLAGFSSGLVLLLAGFFLPPSDGIGTIVDASVFHESFLVGGIAKLLLGDALKESGPISVNPLAIWAWAGLLINAINSIPAGELDGGRISLALWGRKASTRLTGVSIALLGLSSLFSDVAFYWVVLIFFLQRGPVAPLSEEISEPDNKYVALGITVLLLGLLVCLPYPFPFTSEAMLNL